VVLKATNAKPADEGGLIAVALSHRGICLWCSPNLTRFEFELLDLNGAQLPVDLHDAVMDGPCSLSNRFLRLIGVIDRDMEKLLH
jgi:hypothetical protein